MVKYGIEPFFRLGATIENFHFLRAYHIYPPKDFHKWARICAGIVRHYNEGWAGGYHFGIRYWEIWNEPDNTPDVEDNPCLLYTSSQTGGQSQSMVANTPPGFKIRFTSARVDWGSIQ